jgi:hypothetical protein
MSHIVLSDEQAEVLKTASDTVEVRDSQGRILALVQPQDRRLAETIQECKRRLASKGPRIPASRVQAFLRRLTEIDQQGGISQEKMQELLRRTQAGESL